MGKGQALRGPAEGTMWRFHPTRPTYLLFDEGQDTYSDTICGNFLFQEPSTHGQQCMLPCFAVTGALVLASLSSAPDTPECLTNPSVVPFFRPRSSLLDIYDS